MITGRTVFSHDGSISFLAAAGQQDAWHLTTEPGSPHYPYGHWALAEHWERFLHADSSTSLRSIAWGLSRHDLHPPLYFWLLHYATQAVGVHVWTGALLNASLDLLKIFVVFFAARYWLRDNSLAAIAALMWAISPAAVETMQEARHYSLFGLVGLCFGWQYIRIIRRGGEPGAIDLVLLALITGIGALTHYSFAMVAVGAVILAWFYADRTVISPTLASMAVGVIVATGIHPGLLAVFTHAGEVAAPMTLPALVERVLKVGYHLFDLWGRTIAGNVILALALVALLAAVVARQRGGERLRAASATILGPERNPFLLLALLVYALIGAAYLAFVVPRHAIGPQYVAPVWPLMAIGAVSTLRHVSARRWLIPVLLGLALANSAWLVAQFRADHQRYQELVRTVRDYDLLLVDQVARGALLPLIHEMDPATSIFVAHPDDVIARVDDWDPRLVEGNGRRAYVSNLFIDTGPEDRRAIMQILRDRGWEVPEEPVPLFPNWVLFPLGR